LSIHLNPYLSFPDGKAREALEFYQSVLGGELSVMTFGDMGTEGPLADQVMHAQLEAPGGLVLMGADAPSEMVPVGFGDNISVSLSGGPEDAERLRGWFSALAEGGDVRRPLGAAPWGDEFGMLTDRFGIHWLVNIAGSAAS
jgi:PhnB protein